MLDSTRVSNELGAGNPGAAQVAAHSAALLAIVEAVVVSSVLFASRHVFGYAFSNEREVVDYVRVMTPLICICAVLNGLQAVLSGGLWLVLFDPTQLSHVIQLQTVSTCMQGLQEVVVGKT